MQNGPEPSPEQLVKIPELADALESNRFKQFLDYVPFGVAVAELQPSERIIYINREFERLVGRLPPERDGETWTAVPGCRGGGEAGPASLAAAIVVGQDYLGYFVLEGADGRLGVDAWANIIEDETGAALFRLVAIAETGPRNEDQIAALEERILAKDTLLRELQHRVKNNLQMITALIRLEVRSLPQDAPQSALDRLAGRIDALATLYDALSHADPAESVDLGVYLSQIASSVLQAHAREGIRLDLGVDTWPVSVNVAMPTGLVVNELLTNALKHAFVGRSGGTITLRSTVDQRGCLVTVADDGVGLPKGVSWPSPGRLAALIVESLRENARAEIVVTSEPGKGVSASIFFTRSDALRAD